MKTMEKTELRNLDEPTDDQFVQQVGEAIAEKLKKRKKKKPVAKKPKTGREILEERRKSA